MLLFKKNICTYFFLLEVAVYKIVRYFHIILIRIWLVDDFETHYLNQNCGCNIHRKSCLFFQQSFLYVHFYVHRNSRKYGINNYMQLLPLKMSIITWLALISKKNYFHISYMPDSLCRLTIF